MDSRHIEADSLWFTVKVSKAVTDPNPGGGFLLLNLERTHSPTSQGEDFWHRCCPTCAQTPIISRGCIDLKNGHRKMKHQGHFRHVDPLREAMQTRGLIADISRIIDILNVDIASEEEAAGVTDLARPEYPVLARALRARRDNLLATVFKLREQLT
jgi:hypothetical protein